MLRQNTVLRGDVVLVLLSIDCCEGEKLEWTFCYGYC